MMTLMTTRSPSPTLSSVLDPQSNSLNFLRLFFAFTVLVSHAFKLGGFASEDLFGRTTYGTLAVDGFFALSGYLITASALRNRLSRYLWLRVVRIVPGFWACLVITGFVLAFVGWHHLCNGPSTGCSYSNFLGVEQGPAGYVVHNSFLKIHQGGITDSLIPASAIWGWNGSLWTIFYEFLCYLMVAAFALVGILQRRRVLLGLSVLVWIGISVMICVPQINQHFNSGENVEVMLLAQVLPSFLAGSLLYCFREVVRDSGWIAIACVVLFVGGLFLPVGAAVPGFTLTSAVIVTPLLAYPLLWLGAHLPLQSIGKSNDYSYGIYLYAFPIEQLLIDFRVHQHGLVIYLGFTVLLTVLLALASWWFVERNAMKLRALTWGSTIKKVKSG